MQDTILYLRRRMIYIKLFDYVQEVKLLVSGGVLNLEIPDETIERIVLSAFRELQRYIDSTKFITIPYSPCIDMSDYDVNSVSRVYRAVADSTSTPPTTDMSSMQVGNIDPMQGTLWNLYSLNDFNLSNYSYNITTWSTAMQIRNTMSTDLAFIYDKSSDKLYINVSSGTPNLITIEYIPMYRDVEEIVSVFWQDMLIKMSVALMKIALGRVRSRFTQSNALWAQDGDTLLNEGNSELQALRDYLSANTQLVFPID